MENVNPSTEKEGGKKDNLLVIPYPKDNILWEPTVGYGFTLVDLLIDAKVNSYRIYSFEKPPFARAQYAKKLLCIEIDNCKELNKIEEILKRVETEYELRKDYTSPDDEMNNIGGISNPFTNHSWLKLEFNGALADAIDDMVRAVTVFNHPKMRSLKTTKKEVVNSIDSNDEESIRRALRVYEELHWLQPEIPEYYRTMVPMGLLRLDISLPYAFGPLGHVVNISAQEIMRNISGLLCLRDLKLSDRSKDLIPAAKSALRKFFESGLQYSWYSGVFISNRAIFDGLDNIFSVLESEDEENSEVSK